MFTNFVFRPNDFFSNKYFSNHEILKNALVMLKKFINTVKADELQTMLPDIVRLSSHATSECRQLVYDIADSVYTIYK